MVAKKYERIRDENLKKIHGEDFEKRLAALRREREAAEEKNLAPYATTSKSSLGRVRDEGREKKHRLDNRTDFARDRDKILYSKAFFRLGGKTQVFINPNNPLISTRMTHTIHVSQVARTLARAMGLNEDLVEAIALGHDLGHPPFGHVGEEVLSEKCEEIGLPPFRHNIHSLRVVDILEKNGEGLNLTWEVREGILFHDGESDSDDIRPGRKREPVDLWTVDPSELKKPPSTPEACLVRLCDRIAYAGKDIEDGIEAGLYTRDEIPEEYASVLGNTNNVIMDTVIKDIILNYQSFIEKFQKEHGRMPESHEFVISISPPIRNAINGLIKNFNYNKIYLSRQNRKYVAQTTRIIRSLFDSFYTELRESSLGTLSPENGNEEKTCRALTLGQIEDTLWALGHPAGGVYTEKLEKNVEKVKWDNFLSVLREMGMGDLRDGVTDAVPRNKSAAISTILVGNEKDMLSKRCLETKMEILHAGIETRGNRCESIYSFLADMNDSYLRDTNSGEKSRDYLASLTDRMAINIFERIYIPRSIV